jgi:DNA-binding IclR family transcriptional regulator
MSKITEKLVQASWVEVTRSEKDRRLKLITATAAGRKFLSSLEADLDALLLAEGVTQGSSKPPKSSLPASRKKVKVQAREKPFWDFEEPTPSD